MNKREEILNEHLKFRKYKGKIETGDAGLFFSQILKKYYIVTEDGVQFDDGVYYPRKEINEYHQRKLGTEAIKILHAGRVHFGDGFQFLSEFYDQAPDHKEEMTNAGK